MDRIGNTPTTVSPESTRPKDSDSSPTHSPTVRVPPGGFQGTLDTAFPGGGEFPCLLRQIARILDTGIVSGTTSGGVLSNDMDVIDQVCVNLILSEEAIKKAVYAEANGVLPLSLERKEDDLEMSVRAAKPKVTEAQLRARTKKERDEKGAEAFRAISNQEDLDELYERVHCSAIFVMPKSGLVFSGSAGESAKDELGRQFEDKEFKPKIPREFAFTDVVIEPKSFSHVIMPERYRDLSETILEPLKKVLPNRQIVFAKESTLEQRILKWRGIPLPITYPDYESALHGILGEGFTTVEMLFHATRSKVESEEARTQRGWVRI